jgi:hypothetical protein
MNKLRSEQTLLVLIKIRLKVLQYLDHKTFYLKNLTHFKMIQIIKIWKKINK